MFYGKPTWGNLSPAGRYPYADTFAEATDGFKRRRTDVIFKMPNSGEAGAKACVFCQGRLDGPVQPVQRTDGRTVTDMPGDPRTDDRSTWTYSAKHKAVGNGMHYLCSWQSLMIGVFVAHDAGRL